MPYRFKVGAVVVVKPLGATVKRDFPALWRTVGKRGTVRTIHISEAPYRVSIPGMGSFSYAARELEAAPAKKTRKKRGK